MTTMGKVDTYNDLEEVLPVSCVEKSQHCKNAYLLMACTTPDLSFASAGVDL